MKIVIAPQAFKGTLSAREVALAMDKGVQQSWPHASRVLCPVADGGDGTLDLLLSAKKGNRINDLVTGPFPEERLEVYWGFLPDQNLAIIEMASICGLALVPMERRNPLLTTTYGVGEVIKHALDKGLRNFLLAIGGSSSNDGGVGILQALGGLFLDENGQELPLGGGALVNLSAIDLSAMDRRIKECSFTVACDVTNPFLGERGAARVYAPQKGASPEIVAQLEAGMQKLFFLIKRDFGMDLNTVSGSGAAGGAGGGLYAFLGAHLCSGIELMLDQLGVADHLVDSDIVLTGEGRMDEQSAFNKAPIGVARLAKKHGLPVIAIVGSLGEGYGAVFENGIDAIIPLTFGPFLSTDKFFQEEVSQATEQALRLFELGTLWIKG